MTERRTVSCQYILKSGEPCGRKFKVKKMAHRAKHCETCRAISNRKKSRENYRKNRDRIRRQATEARKKRGTKPNLNKSSKRSVKCKCPTCSKTFKSPIFLMNPHDYFNDDGQYKLYPKRCQVCTRMVEGLEYCPDADGHAVGGLI